MTKREFKKIVQDTLRLHNVNNIQIAVDHFLGEVGRDADIKSRFLNNPSLVTRLIAAARTGRSEFETAMRRFFK